MTGNDTERQTKLKYNYMITCDWKAEMNLTPAEREQALRAPHSKVGRGIFGGDFELSGDAKSEDAGEPLHGGLRYGFPNDVKIKGLKREKLCKKRESAVEKNGFCSKIGIDRDE